MSIRNLLQENSFNVYNQDTHIDRDLYYRGVVVNLSSNSTALYFMPYNVSSTGLRALGTFESIDNITYNKCQAIVNWSAGGGVADNIIVSFLNGGSPITYFLLAPGPEFVTQDYLVLDIPMVTPYSITAVPITISINSSNANSLYSVKFYNEEV